MLRDLFFFCLEPELELVLVLAVAAAWTHPEKPDDAEKRCDRNTMRKHPFHHPTRKNACEDELEFEGENEFD